MRVSVRICVCVLYTVLLMSFVAVWSLSNLLVTSLSTSSVLLVNKEAVDIIIIILAVNGQRPA